MKILPPVELNSTKSNVFFLVESTGIIFNSTNAEYKFIKILIRRK